VTSSEATDGPVLGIEGSMILSDLTEAQSRDVDVSPAGRGDEVAD